jgi:hypothetical protein
LGKENWGGSRVTELEKLAIDYVRAREVYAQDRQAMTSYYRNACVPYDVELVDKLYKARDKSQHASHRAEKALTDYVKAAYAEELNQ